MSEYKFKHHTWAQLFDEANKLSAEVERLKEAITKLMLELDTDGGEGYARERLLEIITDKALEGE